LAWLKPPSKVLSLGKDDFRDPKQISEIRLATPQGGAKETWKQKSRFFVAKIARSQKWRCIGDEVRTFYAAEGGI